MNTDIRIHELHLSMTMAERLENARRRELLNRLSADQPGIVTRIRIALGTRLIATGEALRRQDRNLAAESGATTAHALGQ